MKVRNVRFVCIILLVFVLFSSVANAQGGGDVDHNCRFWAAIGADIPGTVIQDHLANLPNSIENLSPANPDGWSVGYYPDGNDVPIVNRGFPRANLDPNFNTAVNTAAGATPRIAVSHIRNTSSGIIPASGDPHPFDRMKNGKHWLMGHNGTITKDILYDPDHPDDGLIRHDYFVANPPQYGSNQSEWIDTDLYQIFVLQTLEDFNWQVKPALGYVVKRLREEIPSDGEKLNFFLTDGTTVWAYREGDPTHTLYYLYNNASGYSAVASQYPSASQGSWVEMNNGELITMQQSGPPVVEDIENYFGDDLLVDNNFDASADSADLRTDSSGQDWYESRADDPTLLTLNTSDVGGNSSNKAAFAASALGNAYLSQEFGAPQSGTFAVQWDIYVDEITNLSGTTPDRTGWMLIGDTSHTASPGPNSDNSERFVYMGFLKDGGGSTGTMDLVARDRDDGWTSFTTIETGLNLDQWYTIKVVCDLDADEYQIYVDEEYKATVSSRNAKTSVTHISFAQWDDGAGAFYVDNVGEIHTLTMAADPASGGTITPAAGDHDYVEGTIVDIEAVPATGYEFDHWAGDVADPNSASTTVEMDADKTVTAHFSPLAVGFLVDNDFDAAADSAALRTDGPGQDWYESRADNPALLTLNTNDVGGNSSKKAAFVASTSGNAYLSQEFGTPPSGSDVFSVEWDIYIDNILNSGDRDRAGLMLIGDDADSQNGPNSTGGDRFVYMAFYCPDGCETGTMSLIANEPGDTYGDSTTWRTIATGLALDDWHNVQVVCDLGTDTYNVYVNDSLMALGVQAQTPKTGVTHISFAQWDDGAGAFYVDDVYEATVPDTLALTMSASPADCGITTPAVGQHVYPQDTTVSIEATAYAGCQFDEWSDDASGSSSSTTVVMDGNKTATANFLLNSTGFLVDNDFDASANDEDLRVNSGGQDWYESRSDAPALLTLNTGNIGGNNTPKARIASSSSGNAYLSQEFGTPQNGIFAVEWDIYVESILNISDPDRTGWMLIGDDTDTSRLGPNSNPGERFVQMAFFRDGGGTSGAMDLVARERGAAFDAFTTVASGLQIGQWYTLKVVCNLNADTYDVYVDDVYRDTLTSYTEKGSVTHISFAQWDDGAGAFYVDNVKQINIPPVAQNDSDDTDEDTPVIIAVLDNDSDADGALVESSVIVVDAPDHGAAVANANGTITYTPNSNYHGSDSFTYTVDDNNGATSNEATVTVTVDSVNDTPTDISLSSNTVAEGMPVGTDVGSFSTTDPDTGDTHTYSLVSGTGDDNNTLFTIDGNALKTNYVFDFEVKNSYSIRVRTNDGHGGTSEKQFTIIVTNVNEPPVFQSIPVEEATVGEVYSYLVTATDDDGDDCSFSLGSGAPDWLTLIDGGNGNDTAMLSGTPPSGSEGEHSVTIQVSDGIADPVEQVISIFVKLGAPEDTKLFLPIIIK